MVGMNTSDASSGSMYSSGGQQQAMWRHPLFFYFLLAYAISWVLLIPYVLAEWGVLSGNYDLLYILHTFGPAASAILVTSVIEGKEGLLCGGRVQFEDARRPPLTCRRRARVSKPAPNSRICSKFNR
jgi:hypothetical protein